MKYVRAFLIIFGIMLMVSIASYFLMPNLSISLSDEDSLIENLSAILFLISFFTGLFLYFRSKLHRTALMIVAVVSLIGFLDEISFGARFFGFNVPVVFGVPIDAVHDIFYLGVSMIYKLTLSYPKYMIPLILTGTVLAIGIIIRYRHQLAIMIRNFYHKLNTYNRPMFLLATFFIILLFSALVIDLDRVDNHFVFFMEEIFELGAAMALFFCNFSLLDTTQPKYSVRKLVR